MKNFLILSNFRSGTHYLHAIIGANGYTMHDEFVGKLQRDAPIELKRQMIDIRRAGRKAGLDRFQIQEKLNMLGLKIYRENKLKEIWGNNCVGILHRAQSRMFYGELSVEEEFAKLRELFQDTTFVILTRNPVEAAVSWHFARHQRSFFSHQKKKREDAPEYSFTEINKWVCKYENEWVWPQELADHIIDYSELLADPRQTINKLGLSIYMQDKMEKQEDQLKYEYIQRFNYERNINANKS